MRKCCRQKSRHSAWRPYWQLGFKIISLYWSHRSASHPVARGAEGLLSRLVHEKVHPCLPLSSLPLKALTLGASTVSWSVNPVQSETETIWFRAATYGWKIPNKTLGIHFVCSLVEKVKFDSFNFMIRTLDVQSIRFMQQTTRPVLADFDPRTKRVRCPPSGRRNNAVTWLGCGDCIIDYQTTTEPSATTVYLSVSATSLMGSAVSALQSVAVSTSVWQQLDEDNIRFVARLFLYI